MTQYVSEAKKGNPCEHLRKAANYLIWAITVIGEWNQNVDGSTTNKTNYITQAQFSKIIGLGQQLCDRI